MRNEKSIHDSANFAQKINMAIPMTVDSANIAADGNGYKLLTAGQIMATAAAVTRAQKVVKFVPWTLSTALTGDNNDLTFTAKYPFTNIKVEYLDPSANSAALSLSITKANTITINLATSGAGAITTTANEIIALVNAHPVAKTMISAALKGTDTGATAVTALTATALASGNYPVGYLHTSIDVTLGDVATSIITAGVLIDSVTDIGLPGFDWIKQA